MTPRPGVYVDVPFEQYLQWDAVSNSRLKLADQSLAHYLAGWQGGETKALRLGSLCHSGQLEPLTIATKYAVMPSYEKDEQNKTRQGQRSYAKTTMYFREKEEQFLAANAGKTIVTDAEYRQMTGIVQSLCTNAQAMKAVGGQGDVEVSFIWEDPETGLLCKGRFDKLKETLFGDLKTTRDAKQFERHLIDLGYHRQMAFYQQGFRILTTEQLEPHIAAVETFVPYCSRAGRMCDQLLKEGLKEQMTLLQKVAAAMDSNNWPGYENPSEWDGPEWYRKRRELTQPVEATIGGRKVIF